MNAYEFEYTDTNAGDANYCWVGRVVRKRGLVSMPELTHYGYDGGTNYVKACRVFERELVKRVKAELGLTGVRCNREDWGDIIVLRPQGSCTIVFISYHDA